METADEVTPDWLDEAGLGSMGTDEARRIARADEVTPDWLDEVGIDTGKIRCG